MSGGPVFMTLLRPSSSQSASGTLYVANLPFRIQVEQLNELFGKYGNVRSSEVLVDPHTKLPRGYAFVHLDTQEDAEKCLQGLNGFAMEGRNLRVEHAKRTKAYDRTPGEYRGPPHLKLAHVPDRDRRDDDRDRRDDRGGYRDRDRDREYRDERRDDRPRFEEAGTRREDRRDVPERREYRDDYRRDERGPPPLPPARRDYDKRDYDRRDEREPPRRYDARDDAFERERARQLELDRERESYRRSQPPPPSSDRDRDRDYRRSDRDSDRYAAPPPPYDRRDSGSRDRDYYASEPRSSYAPPPTSTTSRYAQPSADNDRYSSRDGGSRGYDDKRVSSGSYRDDAPPRRRSRSPEPYRR